MARSTNPLSDKEIKAAAPKDRLYKLYDGGGLILEIPTKQKKRWRLKYRFGGKEKLLSLGSYPQISLQAARKAREELKEQIAKGIDPAEIRKAEKENIKKKRIELKEEKIKNKNTFKKIATDWLKLQKGNLAPVTLKNRENALKRDFYPVIGDTPMEDITRKDIIKIAETIQDRGALYTAHRLLNVCNQIWRYAVQYEVVERNIINDISNKDVLQKHERKHFRTITDPVKIGQLMRAIDGYQGELTTKAALQLIALTFVRPQNIRFAEWDEFDLKKKVWIIPAAKMKMNKEHIVPLTKQALKILKEIEPLTKNAKYVFHSSISTQKAISENTLNQALKRLDFGSEIVSHGFRAMFSTLAYESGDFRSEVIEDLLAHQEKNEIKRAYNRARYDMEKKEVMKWWADFLDEVKAKGA